MASEGANRIRFGVRLSGRRFAQVASCCSLRAGHVAADYFSGEPGKLSRPIYVSSSNSSKERGGRRAAEARMNEANVFGVRGGGVMEQKDLVGLIGE